MKTCFNRWIAALLVLVLTLGLVGCKESEQEKIKNLGFQTSDYYTLEDIPTAAGTGLLESCCTGRESVWFIAEPDEESMILCRVKVDGSGAEILPEFQAPVLEGTPAAGVWGLMLGGEGSLWVCETFPVPQGNNKRTYRVRQLDADTGKELSVVDITDVMSGMDRNYTSGFAVDANGTIYLADQLRIVAVDGQGQVINTLKVKSVETIADDTAGGLLALLPDGNIGALVTGTGSERKVQVIDSKTHDWNGTEYFVRDRISKIYSGNGAFDFYYISEKTVYAAVAGEDIPLRLLPWENAMLDSPDSIKCFVLQENGEAVIFSSIKQSGMTEYDYLLQFTRLLPSDTVPEGAPVQLVYGMIGYDMYVDERIKNFNRTNENCRIVLRDYSEGMLNGWARNPEVYQSALARLYADLTTGKGPDILDSSIPLDGLARQDAMEDLWTWIDNDPELTRDGLMKHVLECMEVNGKLPKVTSSFTINTAVASRDAAGDRSGWTMEEMLDAFHGEMPDFYFASVSAWDESTFNRVSRRSLLYYLINMGLDCFIDWETGECSFDGEDFKSILQLVGSTEELNGGRDLSIAQNILETGLGWFSDMSTIDAAEPVRILPWEGKPLIYMRTISEPYQMVIDDVLFGGKNSLWDYEQKLWDANILTVVENQKSEKTGRDRVRPVYYQWPPSDVSMWDWSQNGVGTVKGALYDGDSIAADCAVGGENGELFASYVGVPSAGGTGSSFSVNECMGISAASKNKEAAWSFVRTLLLPDGHGVEIADNPSYVPPQTQGLSMNRSVFEAQVAPKYWTDPYTGEVFTDLDGEPVPFTPFGVRVGYPEDSVVLAYLLQPSEAQMERFWNLYNAIDHITGSEDDLLEIILEQADVYFAGDKSLDETASLIQNRAKLYVNERR